MDLLRPFRKTEYQLQEPLGSGLTSRVYKAIRRHRGLNIEQTVALKILNSPNEVLALKNEIKILTQIRSPHCVQLLGWENLSLGPALVLEYLEGLSLADLFIFTKLSEEIIEEIIAQVQDGLRDLFKYGLWHGDLSARNIFITQEGVVKLLDFGFSGSSVGATPQFLAPEVWLGQSTSLMGDLFSLGLLREDLRAGTLIVDKPHTFWKQRTLDKINKNTLLCADPSQREFLVIDSQKTRREDLGYWVASAREYRKNTPQTQKLQAPEKTTVQKWRKTPVVVCASMLLFFSPLQPATQKLEPLPVVNHSLKLDVRSHRWAALVLRDKNTGVSSSSVYTPFSFKNLKPGDYELYWRSPKGEGIIPLSLHGNQKIRIR